MQQDLTAAKSAIISVEGENGTTKSTILYTAPLKIVAFACDTGTDRALFGTKWELFADADIKIVDWKDYKPQEAKSLWQRAPNTITVFECMQPLQMHATQMDGNIALIDWVMETTGLALIDPEVKTLGYDTMTMLRDIAADAHLEKAQKSPGGSGRVQLQQIEYGKPNGVIRLIYGNIKAMRKNAVVVHHLTDEMFDTTDDKGQAMRKPTGRRQLKGLSDTYEKIDFGLRTEKQVKNIPAQGGKPAATEITILGRMMRSGYNLSLEGLTYPNPTWNSFTDWVEASVGNRIAFQKRRSD